MPVPASGAFIVAIDLFVSLDALFRQHDADANGTGAAHELNGGSHGSALSMMKLSAARHGSIRMVSIFQTWRFEIA